MKVALIYPPFKEIKNQPSIKEVAQNYGVYPPINLAYVAGLIRSYGHEVLLIDANAENLSKKDVLRKLKRFEPKACLFTVTTYLFHQTIDWMRYLKSNLDVKIIAGGVHTSLYPKETLSHEEIDYIVLGDAEKTIDKLLDSIEKGKKIIDTHIGYRTKDGKTKIGTPNCSEFIENVFPARDQLNNHLYYAFISQRKNFTGLITSRGCPFKCGYCEQGGKTFLHMRNQMDVINEISECYHKHGIREIDFFDPIFTLDKNRTIKILDAIKNLKLDITFSIRTRADRIDDEILKKLSQTGCNRIYYGIESGDKDILKRLNKKLNIKLLKNILRKTKRHGIDTFGYFMIGNPGETKETIKKTISLALKLPLDFVQFNKTTALAGTEMYKDLVNEIKYDFWSRYTLEKTEPDWTIPKHGTKLSDKEIEKAIQEAYKKFYFRPRYAIRRLVQIKSIDEFKRYIKAALSFL